MRQAGGSEAGIIDNRHKQADRAVRRTDRHMDKDKRERDRTHRETD